MRGFEPQADILSTKRKAIYIYFSLILRAQIFSAVLKDGLSDPVGFHLLSLRSRNLWYRYENVIFVICIEDKIMF
jgi:hypothetical protein